MITGQELMQWIPQRPPFVMVDGVEIISKETAKSTLEIRSDNLFLDDQDFTPYGMIEHLAQAASATIGMQQLGQEQVAEGFLGAILDLEIHQLPKKGQTVFADLQIISQIGNLFKIRGTCRTQRGICLSCDLSLAGI